MSIDKLQFSIPANNSKIIELYNKLKKNELEPSPKFQRKLVWRKQHKFNFIDTILKNFPFPEIYISPGQLNIDALTLVDEVVDGQQRLTTIKNYIEGTEVFSLRTIPIPKFSDLSKEEKEAFLNYEVSVRYLKNASSGQVIEIFQRINSTEYSLNVTERTNARWGDSEFICFGKQIVEKDLDDVDIELIAYKLVEENRNEFLNFFHDNAIFTDNDKNRMLALQFILTLLATFCTREYFQRNNNVQKFIEEHYEEFTFAAEIEFNLLETIKFINTLKLEPGSYWFNKANIFTLLVELYKIDKSEIDPAIMQEKLVKLEIDNNKYILSQSQHDTSNSLTPEWIKYFDNAKEAVNEKAVREYRGSMISSLIRSCMAGKDSDTSSTI